MFFIHYIIGAYNAFKTSKIYCGYSNCFYMNVATEILFFMNLATEKKLFEN